MASANTNLRLEISVGLDGLVTGLKVATTGVNEAAQQMSLGMGQASKGFKEHGEHVEKNAQFLRDFKKEQMTNGRVARWYANELATIIPGAEGATGALRGLLVMGFEGFGIGLAIHVAMEAMKLFTEHTERAQKQLEELEKIGTDMGRKVTDALRDMAHDMDGPFSKVSELMYKTRVEAVNEIRKLGDEMDKETKKLNSGWSQLLQTLPGVERSKDKLEQLHAKAREVLIALSEANRQSLPTRNKETAQMDAQVARERITIENSAKDEIVRIRQEMINKVAELDKRKDLTDRQRATLRVAMENDALEKVARIEEQRAVQVAARLRTLRAQNGTEREKLEADLANKIAELRLRIGRDLSQRDFNRIVAAERAAMEAKLAIAAEADRVRIAKQMEADAKAAEDEAVALAEKHAAFTRQSVAWMQAGFSAERAALLAKLAEDEELERAQIDRLAEYKKLSAEQAEAAKRDIEQKYERQRILATSEYAQFYKRVVDGMSSQFAQGLGMMLRGQLSFTNAMRGLWSLFLNVVTDTIAQMITSWITAKITEYIADKAVAISKIGAAASVAAANAYAANVGIPVVGPAVAAGASANAFATTMGMIGLVPAYAGGAWRLQSDQLALLHKDEMVMSAREAGGLRSLVEQGGAGGPSIHFAPVINAVDAAGIDKVLTSRQGTIYKLLEAAVRNGRLARQGV